MKAQQIITRLNKEKPDIRAEISGDSAEAIELDRAALLDTVAFLRDDEETSFDFLNCLFAIDYADRIEVLYILHSYRFNEQLTLKVKLDREKPEVESLCSIHPGAGFHEREAFDLFGVKFLSHPDLRRILMPDEWEGYPMRKDYSHENLIRRPESD